MWHQPHSPSAHVETSECGFSISNFLQTNKKMTYYSHLFFLLAKLTRSFSFKQHIHGMIKRPGFSEFSAVDEEYFISVFNRV